MSPLSILYTVCPYIYICSFIFLFFIDKVDALWMHVYLYRNVSQKAHRCNNKGYGNIQESLMRKFMSKKNAMACFRKNSLQPLYYANIKTQNFDTPIPTGRAHNGKGCKYFVFMIGMYFIYLRTMQAISNFTESIQLFFVALR